MQKALKTFAFAALVLAPAAFAPIACGGSASTATSTSTSTSSGAGTGGSTSSSTSTGTGGASSTATAACNAEAAALCTLRDGCAPNYEISLDYTSIAVCQSRTAQSCVNSLDAKGQANNPTMTEACAAAYPSEACADFFDGNPVTACVPPAGTQAMGAACGASGQCASTYCAVTSTTVCGTCQPLPAVGATCTVQADCGRDLACAIPTTAPDGGAVPTTGNCAAWVAMGGACLTGYNPCKGGLTCVGDDTTALTMGTCQTAGGNGANCQTTHKTVAGCVEGYICITTAGANGMGTCQPIVLGAAGATCGDIGGSPETSFVQCKASGLCKKAAPNDTTGTCVAAVQDGMPCDNDPSIGPPCEVPAKCVPTGTGTAGTCTFPNAATCM